MEFAAKGSTADPYLLFRAANKSAKTDSVEDIPGGPGGACHWPPGAFCTITEIAEADLLSTGFEVSFYARFTHSRQIIDPHMIIWISQGRSVWSIAHVAWWELYDPHDLAHVSGG